MSLSLRRILFRFPSPRTPLSRTSNLHTTPRCRNSKPPSTPPSTTKTNPSSPSNSTQTTQTTPSPSPSSTNKHHTRLHRLLNHTPHLLHPYLKPLLSAPLTHITSFLLLHELTAVIPLIGLTSWFHFGNGMDYLPRFVVTNQYVPDAIEKFGGWFRRRGWFGFGRGDGGGGDGGGGGGKNGIEQSDEIKVGMGKREKIWMVGEKGSRILVEVATAYAITKVLLPVRLVVSLWATPWFARVVLGVFGSWRKGKGRG